MNIVEAIERLGGWAVVVWIVVWLTKRWEHQMGEMMAISRGHHETSLKILNNQNQILDELRREQKRIVEIVQNKVKMP